MGQNIKTEQTTEENLSLHERIAKKSGIPFKGISDIMNTEYPPPWQPVKGLFTEGLNVLVGDSKVGKSWFALHAAVCIALGIPFLGMETIQCPVLYFGLEDYDGRFKNRYSIMGYQDLLNKAMMNDKIMFTTSSPGIDKGLKEKLLAAINETNDNCVVIIDVMQKIKGDRKRGENAYEGDYRILTPLLEVTRESKNKCSIIAIHHTSKDDPKDPFNAINGSNGIMGTADTIIMMRAENRFEKTASICGTSRDCDIESFSIRMNKETCIWEKTDDIPMSKADKQKALSKQRYNANAAAVIIKELVNQHGGRIEIPYAELLQIMKNRFGDNVFRDAKDLAASIRDSADDIRAYDSIEIETGKPIPMKNPETGKPTTAKGIVAKMIEGLPF